MEGVARGPFAKDPLEPVRLLVAGLAQHVVGAFVVLAQFCAQQNALTELQFRQMILDTGQVLVAQFLLEHGEQRGEGLRLESASLLFGDIPKLPEHTRHRLQQVDGAV